MEEVQSYIGLFGVLHFCFYSKISRYGYLVSVRGGIFTLHMSCFGGFMGFLGVGFWIGGKCGGHGVDLDVEIDGAGGFGTTLGVGVGRGSASMVRDISWWFGKER